MEESHKPARVMSFRRHFSASCDIKKKIKLNAVHGTCSAGPVMHMEGFKKGGVKL